MMAKEGDFKITNNKAPHILLQSMIKDLNIPDAKKADIRWLSDNYIHFSLEDKEMKKIKKLIDSLMFKDKKENDV
jgi:hypothetical protein